MELARRILSDSHSAAESPARSDGLHLHLQRFGARVRSLTNARPLRRSDAIEAITVLIISLSVTIAHIEQRSMWRDEATSVDAVWGSWGGFARRWFNQDFVMGLYFAVLKVWVAMFGYSPRALRLLSAWAVALLVTVAWLGARRLWGRVPAALCVVFMLTSQVLVVSAHEARAYALVALLATCSAFALLRTVRTGTRGALFVTFAALTAYSHPLATLAPLGMLAGAFVTTRSSTRRRIVRLGLALGVTLVPLASAQLSSKTGLYWVSAPTLASVRGSARWLLVGLGGSAATWLRIITLAVGVLIAIVGALVTRRKSVENPNAVGTVDVRAVDIGVLAGWAVIPSAVLIVLSLAGHPMFVDRYVMVSVPAVVFLASIGLARLPLGVAGAVGLAVLVAWWGPLASSLRWQSSEDWWGAFRATESARGPRDVVLAGAGRGVMSHYYSLQAKKPAEIFAVWPKQDDLRPFARPAGVDAIATVRAAPKDRIVWLYTFEAAPPDPIAAVADAFAGARCVTSDRQFGDVRVRSYPPSADCPGR